MYQTYKTDTGTDALICFTSSNSDLIYSFRDKLTEKILDTPPYLFLNKDEGDPTEADSWFTFFNSEDEMIAKAFFSKEYPGILAWIFKVNKWKEYEKEKQRIYELVQLEISTSHDHPCIEIYSAIHSEESLSGLVETIARGLNIHIAKNPKLPSMRDIIMSNRKFDTET